jgi:hypothetical protein
MKKHNNYWTKEKCFDIVKNCETKKEFKKNGGAYSSSLRNGWMVEFSNYLSGYKPKGFWTKEKCKEESLKYSTRKELKLKSVGAYNVIIKNKWGEEFFSHMKKIGNKHKRTIYSFEFNDNHVYIGLTCDVERRNKQHLISGPILNHSKITKTPIPDIKILKENLLEVDSIEHEKQLIKDYIENGWFILNKSNGGELGGDMKWTYEKCKLEAKKYEYRNDFSLKSPGAYSSSRRNKWLNDICSHMVVIKKQRWTYEECLHIALKYTNKKDFRLNARNVYATISRNKWLDGICSHMETSYVFLNTKTQTPYQRCKSESEKYEYRNDFRLKSPGAYSLSRKNKWLDDICSHMVKPKPKNAKKILQKTVNGVELGKFNSITEAANHYKLKNSNISKCCYGLRKTAGGFCWEFEN